MAGCQGCPCCSGGDGSANTETSTASTNTEPTAEQDTVPTASTALLKVGMSPYYDILGDLLLLLHGKADGIVDQTPFLRLAAMAMEFELADRWADGVNVG